MRLSLPHTRRPRRRPERGQTMVEFALVLPVLLTVIIAIVELGTVFSHYQQLGDVARAGARQAIVSRAEADPAGVAIAAARDAAPDGIDNGDLVVAVTPPPWTPGAPVTVTATYPYRIDIFGIPVQSGNLTQTTTMRME